MQIYAKKTIIPLFKEIFIDKAQIRPFVASEKEAWNGNFCSESCSATARYV